VVKASPPGFLDLCELPKPNSPPEEVVSQDNLHGEPWWLMVFQQWNRVTANFAEIAQELCQHGKKGSLNYKVAMHDKAIPPSFNQLSRKLIPKFNQLLE
jgi:hypothetical protein